MAAALAVALGTLSPPAAQAAEAPQELAPYLDPARHEPYDWLRGHFADARPEDTAATAAVAKFMGQCIRDARAAMERDLATLGLSAASAKDPGSGTLTGDCLTFMRPELDQFACWTEFAAARDKVLPRFRAFMSALAASETQAQIGSMNLSRELLARPLGEQVLRKATSVVMRGSEGWTADLSPGERTLLFSLLAGEVAKRDHANTRWLADEVAKNGWPTISRVGPDASHQAWLLVQHADDDSAFQVRALRMMEPLAASGEVGTRDHAYLHDRVMLKLAGTQRYATQMECRDGKRQPQPLEDAAGVAAARARAGLDPLDEYLADMDETFGPCPPQS